MHPRGRWLVNAAMICVGILLTAMIARQALLPRQAVIPFVAELPPMTPSQFQNTQAIVGYVGMQRCLKCHPDQHASYCQTAHSQALAKIDLATEPPEGEFHDPHSQRYYRIYHRAGEIRHEESIRTIANDKLVLADLPVKFAIGSGRYSRSYLIDRDGFLFESPATWYAARPGWSLSPGYDRFNLGFERPAEFQCLTCHAGRVETLDRSPQRVSFHSLSIDCERCHGPGELHTQRRESPDFSVAQSQALDATIVNPSHLDRQRQEDICAQCHLYTPAMIALRGRRLQDYRPGLLLADFVACYGIQGAKGAMEVVGHVEQMRLSRCYQASESLTCTTCHDPHAKPGAGTEIAYFRNKCLTCHNEQSCGQARELRIKSHPDDNCVSCHMPRGPTEIPHFAFTHHHIGIHPSPAHAARTSIVGKLESPTPQKLALLKENLALPELEHRRNLGLAYLQFAEGPGQEQHGQTYLKLAREILTGLPRRLDDIEVEAALARVNFGVDYYATIIHSKRVADSAEASPDALAIACYTLGSTYYRLNLKAEAVPWLEKMLKLRPTPDIWNKLSDCLELRGDMDRAVDAARHASELAPDDPGVLKRYFELLQRSGQSNLADPLSQRIHELTEYRKRITQAGK
ncbi:MAG: decaheme c-type cytochrome, DmsE family [Planctomycetaceae bacterium]|nr:decaheme c-type cytochrome, DmsE family [Planctomycetaceae bacterium]